MDRFATYMENTQRNMRDYAKMRKYTRDIEERYDPKNKTQRNGKALFKNGFRKYDS